MTYGTDAAATHLTNAYWYRDSRDMLQCDPTSATVTAATNRGFITRWDKLGACKALQISDVCIAICSTSISPFCRA